MHQRTNCFLLAVSILLASCGGKETSPRAGSGKQMPTPKAEAYILRPARFQETLEVPGTLLSAESVEIHPEVSGRIIQLNLMEGRAVSTGYLIAKLDDAELQAQLIKIQTQLEIAEQTLSRQSKLLAIQGISQQDYDLSVLQVRNLKADIGILRTAIDKTEIRAPFPGKLGLRNISVGAYVTPATSITSLLQTSNLKIDFQLPEKYAQGIQPGSWVNFRTSGGTTSFKAVVYALAPGLTESNRSLNVRALVQAPDPSLLPGAFATVSVALKEKPAALLLPAQAVIPQARGKRVIRFVGGMATFVDITTGTRTADQVEVLSGLNAGDTILLSGLMSIRPNTAVQIGKIQNPSSSN